MQQMSGAPFYGAERLRVKRFLETEGLRYDDAVSYTVNLLDGQGRIAATGSLDGTVLKCILVRKDCRGKGLAERIVTELAREAARRGRHHLLLYTKPGNYLLFSSMGFGEIARTNDVILMENRKNGIVQYVRSLPGAVPGGKTGAVICNCNPFTRGHRYLIENAARQCDFLYVFVLSEDSGMFPPEVRLSLVRRGVEDLPNVCVSPTGPYLISRATFPDYFIKNPEKKEINEVYCELDLKVFFQHFALPLGISARFVGTEPNCRVTAAYNRKMHSYLGERGMQVQEMQRLKYRGEAVSASLVRKLLKEGKLSEAGPLLPDVTREYLFSPEGRTLLEKYRNQRL